MKILIKAFLKISKLVAKEVSKELKKDFLIRELSLFNSQSNTSILNTQERKERIVVSLTSFGARASTVFLAIESLAQQSMLADEMILWLSNKEFSDKNLPTSLVNLKKRGLKIKFCEDIKSYKKLIPTLLEYPNDIIITIDDDIIYNYNLIMELYSTYKQFPNNICCHRGHLIKFNKSKIYPYDSWKKNVFKPKPSHNIMATGVGGVLYFPNCFHKDITNKELFMKLCPTNDDLWFKFMALLKGTKYKTVSNTAMEYNENITLDQSKINHLAEINVLQGGNDRQIENIIQHYKINLEQYLN